MVSGQSSVVSRMFSGDPKGSAGESRNADFGLRNRGQGNVEKSKIQSPNREVVRITQKLIGRTKPFRRKTKATIMLGRALPHVADGSGRLCMAAPKPLADDPEACYTGGQPKLRM